MSDYIKSTNFAVKDSLPTGNSGKVIKGTEIDSEFNAIASAVGSKADTNSPTFTGTPVAPTASAGTNTTQIATTAFVTSSPAFSGTPTAPTAASGTNTTQIATTAFVKAEITSSTTGKADLASPAFTGTPTAPTASAGTNTTQVATTAFVKTAVDASTSVGVSQTWTDVSASRAYDTTYTNSTGRAIQVAITVGVSGGSRDSFSINGNIVASSYSGGSTTTNQFYNFIIPNGNTYRLNTITGSGGIVYWYELR